MFLEDIHIVTIEDCVQEKGKYVALTKTTTDLTKVLPYLNAIVPRADYNPEVPSIKFVQNKIEFTLVKEEINVQKFVNRTELMELLDWVRDLINDTYDSMDEITPCHETKHYPPALTIYTMLPKTNCRECGEKSCMAFASRLFKMEVDIEDCPPLCGVEYSDKREKLERAFA